MTQRSTTIRDRDRRIIARDKPPCGICGQPIDYTLRHPHPASYTVDHVIPIAKGGLDVIENKQAAHRTCNRDKWHTIVCDDQPPAARTFETARTW